MALTNRKKLSFAVIVMIGCFTGMYYLTSPETVKCSIGIFAHCCLVVVSFIGLNKIKPLHLNKISLEIHVFFVAGVMISAVALWSIWGALSTPETCNFVTKGAVGLLFIGWLYLAVLLGLLVNLIIKVVLWLCQRVRAWNLPRNPKAQKLANGFIGWMKSTGTGIKTRWQGLVWRERIVLTVWVFGVLVWLHYIVMLFLADSGEAMSAIASRTCWVFAFTIAFLALLVIPWGKIKTWWRALDTGIKERIAFGTKIFVVVVILSGLVYVFLVRSPVEPTLVEEPASEVVLEPTSAPKIVAKPTSTPEVYFISAYDDTTKESELDFKSEIEPAPAPDAVSAFLAPSAPEPIVEPASALDTSVEQNQEEAPEAGYVDPLEDGDIEEPASMPEFLAKAMAHSEIKPVSVSEGWETYVFEPSSVCWKVTVSFVVTPCDWGPYNVTIFGQGYLPDRKIKQRAKERVKLEKWRRVKITDTTVI